MSGDTLEGLHVLVIQSLVPVHLDAVDVKDIRNLDSIKPPCSSKPPAPEEVIQMGDGNPLTGAWCMDKPLFTQVEPHMGNPAPIQPEKEQVARLQLPERDRKGVAAQLGYGTRDRNPHLPVGIVHQAAAIHAVT